jgi:hypothetical protein
MDAEVAAALRRLEEEERALSLRRTKVHERLSFFPTPAAAEQERQLSLRRRDLHAEIDRLRNGDAREAAGRLRRLLPTLTADVFPGLDGRRQRLIRFVVFALTLATVDLWVKHEVVTPDWAFHHRSMSWALGSLLLLCAAVPLTRVPSTLVTIGAAFLSGGVLGNLVSGVTHHLTVPNPFLVTTPEGGIAFNLADTFIVSGNLILIVALCTLAVRHRARISSPFAFARSRN